jgi:hypothetical protein
MPNIMLTPQNTMNMTNNSNIAFLQQQQQQQQLQLQLQQQQLLAMQRVNMGITLQQQQQQHQLQLQQLHQQQWQQLYMQQQQQQQWIAKQLTGQQQQQPNYAAGLTQSSINTASATNPALAAAMQNKQMLMQLQMQRMQSANLLMQHQQHQQQNNMAFMASIFYLLMTRLLITFIIIIIKQTPNSKNSNQNGGPGITTPSHPATPVASTSTVKEDRYSPRIIPCGIVAASTGEPCRRPVNQLGDVCRLHYRFQRTPQEIAAMEANAPSNSANMASPPLVATASANARTLQPPGMVNRNAQSATIAQSVSLNQPQVSIYIIYYIVIEYIN